MNSAHSCFYKFAGNLNKKTWSVEAHKAKDVQEQAKMKKTEIAFMKVGK